ncbi:MAG: hypothetical protein ACRYGI_20195 [Janthinobacterium lividum]
MTRSITRTCLIGLTLMGLCSPALAQVAPGLGSSAGSGTGAPAATGLGQAPLGSPNIGANSMSLSAPSPNSLGNAPAAPLPSLGATDPVTGVPTINQYNLPGRAGRRSAPPPHGGH